MANTVEGLPEVCKDHSRQLLLVYSPEDIITNQKAQRCRRMVLAVPAPMLSEFVLLNQEVIKLNQGNLDSHLRKNGKQKDRPVVIGDLMITVFSVGYNHRLFRSPREFRTGKRGVD